MDDTRPGSGGLLRGGHVLSAAIASVLDLLRTAYPDGVPATDYFPLLALLRRRLSDAKVVQVVIALAGRGEMMADANVIRVMISQITDQMPRPEEVARGKRRLWDVGWNISDEFSPPPGG